MGIGFRFLTGKWGCLSLAGSQSLLQQPLQAFYISPQLLDFSFECGIFLLQACDLLYIGFLQHEIDYPHGNDPQPFSSPGTKTLNKYNSLCTFC